MTPTEITSKATSFGNRARVGCVLWWLVRSLHLIAFCGFFGAFVGIPVGTAIAGVSVPQEPYSHVQKWERSSSQVGWLLGTFFGIIGVPTGVVQFCPDSNPKQSHRDKESSSDEPVTGPVAFIMGIMTGALLGLIVTIVLVAILLPSLVIDYFFLVLSPFGPDGWWPLAACEGLAKSVQTFCTALSRGERWAVIPFLLILGTPTILGAVTGPFGTTTSGNTSYQFFRSRKGRGTSAGDVR